MRKILRLMLLPALVATTSAYQNLRADANFASQDAGIFVGSGGRFHVSSAAGMAYGGKLSRAEGGAVTGSSINFIDGKLNLQESLSGDVTMTGVYAPSSSIITLASGILNAEPYAAIEKLYVSGTSRLIGQPHIAGGSIELADSSTTLTVAVQSSINGDISLNGGTLSLADDLHLAKGVTIEGPGTINGNGFNVEVDDQAGTVWTINNVTVNNVSNIVFATDESVAGQLLAAGGLTAGQVIEFDAVQVPVSHAKPVLIDAKNVVLDGKGGAMSFAGNAGSSAGALFRVSAGASVKLKNVTLDNVTKDTFAVAAGGTLTFGENVVLQLGDDVALTSGMFAIADATSGANLVTVRGVNGKKRLTLAPADKTQASLLDLGNNSLVLQNVELRGAEFVTASGSDASIALAGDATVDVGADTALNFDVEDSGNELALTADGLTLSGAISWSGSAAENNLAVRFAIPKAIADKIVDETDADGNIIHVPVKRGNPLVIFDGDPGIYLSSGDFVAGLSFPDRSVSVLNGLGANTNAMVFDANSFLSANSLEILGHPIKQSSAQFQLFASLVEGAGIDNAFVRSGAVGARARRKHRSAFAQIRERERARLAMIARPAAKAKAPVSKQNANVKSKRQQARPATRSAESAIARRDAERAFRTLTPADVERLINENKTPQELVPNVSHRPSKFDTTYQGGVHDSEVVTSGAIWYDGAYNNNFFTDDQTPYTIELSGGARLRQKEGGRFALLEDQEIIISGLGNVIELTGDSEINVTHLSFEPDTNGAAELRFVFKPAAAGDRPRLVVPAAAAISFLRLAKNASLSFSGPGDVVIESLFEVLLDGTNDDNGAPLYRPELRFAEGARLMFGQNALSLVLGKGAVTFDNASLDMANYSLFLMGLLPEDEMSLSVVNGARFTLVRGAAGFYRGNNDFTLDRSQIQLFDESNFSLGTWWFSWPRPYLRSLSVTDSTIAIAANGKLWIHENPLDEQNETRTTRVDLKGLTITGMQGMGIGRVMYGNPRIYGQNGTVLRESESFEGQLRAVGPVYRADATDETVGEFLAPFVVSSTLLLDGLVL